MDITFTPPLAHETRLSFSPIHSTATLVFTASFNSTPYSQLIYNDAKLQVWSNVRLDTDKPGTAEWRAFDFQFPAPSIAGSTNAIQVSLLDNALALEGDNSSHDSLLSLELSVPLASRGCAFSYTYRLAYPTGEIRWLGEYGRNRDGSIVIEQSWTDTQFILHEGWSTQNERYAWTDTGKSVDDLEVARLSSPSHYSIRSIGRDSFFDAEKAHVACFVPRVSPHSMMLDPTYILSASSGITFTVSSLGVIRASGTGSLLLHAPGPGTNIHSLLAHTPSDVAALDTTTGHLLLTSGQEGRHPLQAFVLPMVPRQYMPIRIASNKLSALLHDDVMQYSISSPLNLNIHFLVRSTNQEVRFLTDPMGGAFVLSPVYNLKDGQYQISVLSEYKSIRLQIEEPDLGNLPTPPPSPRLRPSSPSLSSRETSVPESIPSDPDFSLVQNDSDDDGYSETQAPAIVDTLLAYIISIATLLFTSLYRLFFGLPGENTDEWDTGDREEKHPMMSAEDASAGKQVPPVIPVTRALVVADQSRHPKLLSHSLLVETYDKKVRAAFRRTDLATPSALLTVELNGRKMDPTFTKLDECISLLEVDGGTEGSLKITVV